MADVHVVPGKTPTSTANKTPFEIVIRTRDPHFIMHGGPEELVIPCDGYYLCTHNGESQESHAQGCINQLSFIESVLKLTNPEVVLAACAMKAMADKAKGDQ